MTANVTQATRVQGTEKSWHGLENTIDPQDARDISKVMLNMGLQDVRKVQLVGLEVSEDGSEVKQHKTDMIGLYSHDDKFLGAHGADSYHVHQPRETLEPYFDIINTLDDGKFRFDFGARLKDGKVWVANFVCEEIAEVVSEKHQNYLSVSSSFDGSRSTMAGASSVRQVCCNTVAMWDMSSVTRKVKFKHRKALPGASTFLRQIEGALDDFEAYKSFAELLNTHLMTKDVALKFLQDSIFKPELKEVETATGQKVKVWTEPSTRAKGRMEKAEQAFETTVKEIGSNVTAWTLWNAVTRFSDHEAGVRMTEDRKAAGLTEADLRYESNLYGSSAKFKAANANAILEMVSPKAKQLQAA